MKLIYEWEVPPGHPNFTGYDDIAQAYRIYEDKAYSGGICVRVKYHGKWGWKLGSVRPLIRQLVNELIDKGV